MGKYTQNELMTKFMGNIKLKLQACLFMLCENAMHLSDSQMWPMVYEPPESLTAIKEDILKTIKELEPLLNTKNDQRDEKIQHILTLNKNLIAVAESVYCYFSFNNLLQEIIIHYQRQRLTENEKEVPIDLHGFYHDCLDFIEKDNDSFAQKNNIAKLMKSFPLRMARDKYYTYVEDGIHLLVKDSAESFIDDIMKTYRFKFMPAKMPEYGKYYPQIKDKLDTIFALDFASLDYDSLKELYKDMDDNLQILQEISDYMSAMHECLNFLTLILTFCKDLDYLIEDTIEYKDIFYTSIENIFSENAGIFNENLYDLIDASCEKIVDKIIEDEHDEGLLTENIDTDTLSDDTMGILKIHRIITNGYYETLSEVVYPVNAPIGTDYTPASDTYIKSRTAEFTDYIKTSLEGVPPAMQRLIKGLFLDSIPSPFTALEFQEYINYILETTNGFAKRLMILDSVGAVFESTGFVNAIKATGQEHHHSNGECDCGHDHHSHDHSHCDCGHSHPHK